MIIDWKCPSCKKLAEGKERLVMKVCGGCQVPMIRGYEYGKEFRELKKELPSRIIARYRF